VRGCDLTLGSPAENLACDEAFLDECEGAGGADVLRFWEPTGYFVVVGYANRVEAEVDLGFCRREGIPVLRRCTGGGTVLQGPGCLNYSLVLRISNAAALATIQGTNEYVMSRHQAALEALVHRPVEKEGHTDLAVAGLKFSGNAQRRKRECLIFHGTFLLDFELDLVGRALPMPSKQPAYRAGRSHSDFLMNLPVAATEIKAALRRTWAASGSVAQPPHTRVSQLVREKYGRDDWNLKF
jgi:lipoate---protein ligase